MGGYLPLELGNMGGCGREPFGDVDESDKMRFNSARYAICYAVGEGGYRKIYIPLYMCDTVAESLTRYSIEYETYSIGRDFMPESVTLGDDECIMVCNYFGIHGNDFYAEMCRRYHDVIFDNTQAFYASPVISSHIYNVYSARKFVGCADGAYLIKKGIVKKELPQSESWARCEQLLMSHEKGTNYGYQKHLQSEDDITAEGMRQMSELTRKYLDCIQYDDIKRRRKAKDWVSITG
jgi:hypothetical protein